jgi:hypothetical protein
MVDSRTAHPLPIDDHDLARAWGRAFLHILSNPGTTLSPLMVTITGFGSGGITEDSAIRGALDSVLTRSGKAEINTVANTIFPESLWRYCEYDRHRLYAEYIKNIPRYRALAPHQNNRGLYFERLIAYGPKGSPADQRINQLEFLIDQYTSRSGVRTSMLQASLFDATQDHTPAAQLGFPCLQQISFVPVGDGTLALNAFYATQQIFDKAYGNYLGLARLGHFVARALDLTFGRLNCFVGVAKLERTTKDAKSLAPITLAIRTALGESPTVPVLRRVAGGAA